MLRLLLEAQGYQVISAGTSQEALDAVVKHSVSLIITDLYLPGMSGFALMRALHKIGRAIPPIIAVTGFVFLAGPESQAAAAALGARTILTKPINTATLLQAITAALSTVAKEDTKGADKGREA